MDDGLSAINRMLQFIRYLFNMQPYLQPPKPINCRTHFAQNICLLPANMDGMAISSVQCSILAKRIAKKRKQDN